MPTPTLPADPDWFNENDHEADDYLGHIDPVNHYTMPVFVLTNGNAKRYSPVTNGIGDAERARAAFIEKYGQQAWDRRCREWGNK